MFFYLYDQFVSDPKHDTARQRVEARLIELGINGRIERLTPVRNIKELIKMGLKQEAHTVVVVGGDETFLRTMNIIANKDAALAYIPFRSDTGIAKLLGIPDTMAACDILSRRIVSKMPLLRVNQNYALSTVVVPTTPPDLNIECDGEFTLSTSRQHSLLISNLEDITAQQPDNEQTVQHTTIRLQFSNPTHGKSSRKKNPIAAASAITAQQIKLSHTNSPVSVTLDNLTTLKTPLSISRIPEKLKVIVGKNRTIL